MRQKSFCFRSAVISTFLVMAAPSVVAAQATPPSQPADHSLAQSVQELRQQVEELRAAVAEIRSEASQYRAESDQLRKALENMRAAAPAAAPSVNAAPPSGSASADQRLSSVEESTQVVQNELRTQYQTKVESASKYRVRLSGLVLFNLFGNSGSVDNIDVPTWAAPSNNYGATSSFGATLRQSELGLEVFGPTIRGAKTSGQVQFDFGGGFPAGALDGVNTGIVRLRTATVRMDWQNTSIVAGQDNLFISPNSPTSFASLLTPSFGYSGNLWAWTPQIRVEHRIAFRSDQDFVVQAGILDNITGDLSNGSHRQSQAGESTGSPAYALRTGWMGTLNGNPAGIGVSGYFSPQHWGAGWNVDGWAIGTDWRVPIARQLELSGEIYRGKAVGGIGGGIGQSVIFGGTPADPYLFFRPVNSVGGWSQLKFIVTPRLEFNGVFGMDNPFAADLHAFGSPIGPYGAVLAANRSQMANIIFRPRSDLLLSAEYRHLRTTQLLGFNTADQVNVMMGVLF